MLCRDMEFSYINFLQVGFYLCHSWDIGTAHIIVFSTELYFYVKDGVRLAEYQYDWLEKDLKVLVASLKCDA